LGIFCINKGDVELTVVDGEDALRKLKHWQYLPETWPEVAEGGIKVSALALLRSQNTPVVVLLEPSGSHCGAINMLMPLSLFNPTIYIYLKINPTIIK
jgi:hypothetical protein